MEKRLKIKFLIFLGILILGNIIFLYTFYTSFLQGPPIEVGRLTFTELFLSNTTVPTNYWEDMHCYETNSDSGAFLTIFESGLSIRPYKWSIVKRGIPITTDDDLDRYLYKDFPYLNMTYINFRLWVFDGRNETLVINYTAPIWKFNENNTEFPYYYSKKLDYQVWHAEVYYSFLNKSVKEIKLVDGVKIYVLFKLYANRTVEMANHIFLYRIFAGWALTNLFIITAVALIYIYKMAPSNRRTAKNESF
ncbi:MAG: hypothetical protein J7L07_05100 [Candidatus Odinarchaeota archaeon]|nr:hypothetical protein [Candidatus Odinarchaeota archaeon]